MLTLRLFHGRRTPDEELENWGTDGPVLGPLESVHMTYGNIRLATSTEVVDLLIIEGLIYYDDVLYGDAALTEEFPPTAFPEQALADPSPSFQTWRDTGSAVQLPAAAFDEYHRRVQVFTDSIRELAGDHAAASLVRALTNVVKRKRRRR